MLQDGVCTAQVHHHKYRYSPEKKKVEKKIAATVEQGAGRNGV